MSLPLVPAKDFDARADGFGRIGELGVSVARAVLVEGKGLSETAREFECSKQFVDKCAKKVRAVLEERPADWVRVDEWFPPELAPTVRAMADLARQDYAKKKR